MSNLSLDLTMEASELLSLFAVRGRSSYDGLTMAQSLPALGASVIPLIAQGNSLSGSEFFSIDRLAQPDRVFASARG